MRTPRPSTGPSPRHPVMRGAASHTRRRLTLRPALLLGLVTALLAPPPPAEARSFAAQTGALSVHPAESRTAPAGAPVRYGWPLAAPHPVVRTFSAPATPYGSGHRGVDLGGTAGEPVLAAGDGTVVFAGQLFDRPVVSIDHQGGLRTTYEPVEPIVRTGNRVRRGEQIGTLQAGHAGCPTTACLHWGARRGQEYVNPIRLVSPGRVRLLPLPPPGEPARTRAAQIAWETRSMRSAATCAGQPSAAGSTRRADRAGPSASPRGHSPPAPDTGRRSTEPQPNHQRHLLLVAHQGHPRSSPARPDPGCTTAPHRTPSPPADHPNLDSPIQDTRTYSPTRTTCGADQHVPALGSTTARTRSPLRTIRPQDAAPGPPASGCRPRRTCKQTRTAERRCTVAAHLRWAPSAIDPSAPSRHLRGLPRDQRTRRTS